MRRVIVAAGGRVELTDAAVPTPHTGEALIATTVAGVCGTDTNAAVGRHPFIRLPYAPGHEVVGVIEALEPGRDGTGCTGAGGAPLVVGDRVTVEPPLPCGQCKPCRTARPNLCERLEFFGCNWSQGGMAEHFTVRTDRLHRVPDGIGDLRAALAEPLATPVHAVRLAGPSLAGKTVAILGAGTIGLLTLVAARAAGATGIVVTDPRADKRERAQRLGAAAALDAAGPDLVQELRATLGESADVVFDCVAVETTVRTAVLLAGNGGTVVIVGVPAGEVLVPLHLVQDNQIRIQGSATYLTEDFAEALRLLDQGDVSEADMITCELPLERAAEAFAASASGAEVKVVLRPEGRD